MVSSQANKPVQQFPEDFFCCFFFTLRHYTFAFPIMRSGVLLTDTSDLNKAKQSELPVCWPMDRPSRLPSGGNFKHYLIMAAFTLWPSTEVKFCNGRLGNLCVPCVRLVNAVMTSRVNPSNACPSGQWLLYTLVNGVFGCCRSRLQLDPEADVQNSREVCSLSSIWTEVPEGECDIQPLFCAVFHQVCEGCHRWGWKQLSTAAAAHAERATPIVPTPPAAFVFSSFLSILSSLHQLDPSGWRDVGTLANKT